MFVLIYLIQSSLFNLDLHKKRELNFMATNRKVERETIILVEDVVADSKHIEPDQVGTLTSLAASETRSTTILTISSNIFKNRALEHTFRL